MTHEYTLLLGGRIVRGDGGPDATALAWAAGTVLALGTDEEILAISRGDSAVVALHGLTLAPAPGSVLEVGAPADALVLRGSATIAVIRGGHVVDGELPGL